MLNAYNLQQTMGSTKKVNIRVEYALGSTDPFDRLACTGPDVRIQQLSEYNMAPDV
jgi:hypothetical protein